MKTTEEMIDVMYAHGNGAEIECYLIMGKGLWECCEGPIIWNWEKYDYRIANTIKRPDPVCWAYKGDQFRCEGCVNHSEFEVLNGPHPPKEGVMQSHTPALFVLGFMLAVASFCIVFENGKSNGIRQVQQEAIKAGVAVWASYPDGTPQFKWKVEAEKKP